MPTIRSAERPEGWRRPETEEANLLANRIAALAELVHSQGGYFSIENPWGSYLWDLPAYKKLAKLESVKLLVMHPCAYGGQHYKPTAMLTNAPWLVVACRKCEDSEVPRDHVKLIE